METKTPTARVSPKAAQDMNSDHGFNQPAPQPKAYWTLWRGGKNFELQRAWDDPQRNPSLPHEGLCICGFDSPVQLLADLMGKGWSKEGFDGTENRFALIEPTAKGITVTAFETYQAACHAHALSVQ